MTIDPAGLTERFRGTLGELLGIRFVETTLDRVVAELPLKQRLAFTLRKVHDLDYEAIGESLQCSPESARAHVFQALKKIRLSLNGHELPAMEPTR